MNDDSDARFIRLFNQGFEEVVLPRIEDLGEEIRGISKRLEVVETRLDVVERKLDRAIDQLMDHEKGLKKLEHTSITP